MNKKIGETPLEALSRLRLERPDLSTLAMTYAGRLDPMAEGVLVVLVGDECKKKEEFLGLDKTYEAMILWGVSTDTYDILGRIVRSKPVHAIDQDVFKRFIGNRIQKFPPFSSKPVKGMPLHMWSRAGRINEIQIPEKSIKIYNIEHLDTKKVRVDDMKRNIIDRISLVKGDFRQQEIINDWTRFFDEKSPSDVMPVSSIRLDCSSGTYIRGLVDEMGELISAGATLYALDRKKVGGLTLST
jgi:tRNA pseudouridine(55) synthase